MDPDLGVSGHSFRLRSRKSTEMAKLSIFSSNSDMISEHVIDGLTGLVHFRTKVITALRRKSLFGPKVYEPRPGPVSSNSDLRIRLRDSQNTYFEMLVTLIAVIKIA